MPEPTLRVDPYGQPAPQLRPGRQSPILYHYTNDGGLLGVVQENAFWATVLRFQNDSSEVMHAFEIAADLAAGHPAMSSTHKPGLDQFIDYVRSVGNPEPTLCTVSFSEDDNVLSQWRGYGGYAIGFDWDALNASGPNWRLVQCRYDRDEQQTVLSAALDRALASHERNLAAGGSPGNLWSSIYGEVLMVSPAIKHPDFHEEREWRLVSAPVEPPGLKVRRGNHGLVTYTELPLPLSPDGSPSIREVMVGPGPHQAQARAGVVGLFVATGRFGMDLPMIQCSRTPYLP